LLDKEAEVTVALVALVVLVVVIAVVVVVVVLLAAVVVEAAEGVEDVVSELETETQIITQRNYQRTVLRHNVMNGIIHVVITEEYNVKVNSEELIGSTEHLTV